MPENVAHRLLKSTANLCVAFEIHILRIPLVSGLTAFCPVTGLFYIIAILLQELIVFFLYDTSLVCFHGLFR